MRTTRRARGALALAATSTLLAGCFSVEATFTIKDDATADVDFVTLIDVSRLEEFAGLFGEDAGALDELSGDALLEELTGDEDPCADFVGSFSDYDVSTRTIDEDGQVGVGCTASGIPLDELNTLGDDTSSFSIEQDDSGTRFEAVLEGVDELAGDPAETAEMTEMLGLELDELFTIKFTVSAPGSLGDNNASSTSGSTATWDVKPDADFVTDGNATMRAEWTPGGGGGSSSWWIILVVIAAVAAIAVIAWLLIRRSKGGSDGDATAGATDTATAAAPMMAPPDPSTPPPPPPSSPPPPAPPSTPPPPASSPPPPPPG